MGISPSIALVTTETRLLGLLAKYGTKGSARFRMKSARAHYANVNADADLDLAEEADFERYVEEDTQYQEVVKKIRSDLEGLGYPVIPVPKPYLATYFFGMTQAVVVVGPDGLVANAAKYVGELPIIGVNPLPKQYDGVLLKFTTAEARKIVSRTLEERIKCERVTLAKVKLSDGQTMLAFNDFFVGKQSHVSARYTIYASDQSENQSSSGVIIATGAGSTGWLSSVYNMTAGVGKSLGQTSDSRPSMTWDTKELRWVVREPFRSQTSQIDLVTGTIDASSPFRMESLMPDGGVIFSDGVESDYLSFNSGTIAEFSIAPVQSKLVIG
ncbi:MAG: hypothetical protein WBD20_12130 [Pirellulaceae bacterium]